MTVSTFVATAKRLWAALVALAVIFLSLALLFYAGASDRYVTEATTTSKASEDRGFDVGTLGGLAALASGGQRPTFEQLTFLVQSDAVIRDLLPTIKRRSPRLAEELLKVGAPARILLGIEQSARAAFGKPPKIVEPTDRMIAAIHTRLKVDKTAEGYIKLSFTSAFPDGQLVLIQSLLSDADAMIRARENIDYRRRVATYQSLLDQQSRTVERAVLVSLIGREYTNFVTAQSGATFSFIYIEPPLAPKRIYAPSLLTLTALALFAAFAAFVALVFARAWLTAR